MLKALTHSLLHLFYPRLCEGCSRPLLQAEEVVCMSCSLQLSRTEYHHIADNETAMRFAGRIPFKYATSFCYFSADSLLQHLLHQLKYNNRKPAGVYLGSQLGYELADTSWIKEIDLLVPVPLHPKKEATRGYNQSQLICEGISDVLGIPVAGHVLVRTRHTDSQTKKTRAERVDNMADAFSVALKEKIAGKHILLVDDVLTTGATLEACALALLSAGNTDVSIATIGIA